MNSVILIGRLTKEPELSYTPNNQTAVCKFTLAVDRTVTEGTDFIRIVVFNKQAENCDRYLGKGSQCAVAGRIQTGSYKNKKGDTVYTTDVIANNVQFLNRPAEQSMQTEEATIDVNIEPHFEEISDDIPF